MKTFSFYVGELFIEVRAPMFCQRSLPHSTWDTWEPYLSGDSHPPWSFLMKKTGPRSTWDTWEPYVQGRSQGRFAPALIFKIMEKSGQVRISTLGGRCECRFVSLLIISSFNRMWEPYLLWKVFIYVGALSPMKR